MKDVFYHPFLYYHFKASFAEIAKLISRIRSGARHFSWWEQQRKGVREGAGLSSLLRGRGKEKGARQVKAG